MIQLLGTAWGHVQRYRQLWLAAWLLNLLLALGLALLPALNLIDASRWTAVREAADGLDGWLILETFGPFLGAQAGLVESDTVLPETVTAILQQATTILAIIPILAWLSHAWLKGGILLVYSQAPQPFRWRPFFRACWRWFIPFLAAGFLQAVGTLLIVIPTVAFIGLLAGAIGGWLWWVTLPFLGLLLLLWLAVGELTAVIALVQQTRNIFRTFFQALRFVVSNLRTIFSIYLPTVLVLLATHALYRYGLNPSVPRTWWPLVLLVQQSFIVLRLVLRLWRFAAGTSVWRLSEEAVL